MRENSAAAYFDDAVLKFDRQPGKISPGAAEYEILPPEFSIPKIISEAVDGKAVARFRFDFMKNGLPLEAVIHLKTVKNGEEPARLKLFFIDKTTGKKIAEFYAALAEMEKPLSTGNEKNMEKVWNIHHRLVGDGYRGKGLGTSGFAAMEQIIKRFSEENPELAGDFIEVDTNQSSVARLLIDQYWLTKQNPGEILRSHGPNMGYRPLAGYDNIAIQLISAESDSDKEPEVKLIKSLVTEARS